MADSLLEVISALGTLIRMGFLPIYSELTVTDQISYLKILAAAFAGSGSAGVIVVYFRDKIRQIPLLFCRDHVIICGLDEITESLVRQFKEKKIKTIVIGAEKDPTTWENIRRYSTVLLPGDPKEPAILSFARVKRARAVLALTESDGLNAEIALSALKILEERTGKPLTCILQVSNPGLWRIIREQALLPVKSRPVRIDFYNGPALGARVLLGSYFTPRIPEWGRNSSLLIVVGAGRLGESIITRASREWFEKGQESTVLQVVLVDKRAETIRDRLLATYPHLRSAVNITPVCIDVQAAQFQNAAFLKERESFSQALVFVCLNDDTAGLTAALTLSHHLAGKIAQIHVRMDHNPGLSRLVEEEGTGEIQIHPFSSLSIASGCDLVLGGIREILARAIHDHYLVTMSLYEQPPADPALVPWENLPGRLKESNRRQAENIMEKLRAIGCDIIPMTDWTAAGFSFSSQEVEYLAEMEHVRWMEDMKGQGFSPGTQKDASTKTHPSMVAYHELPESEKEKDREAVRMIPHYLALIDFQIYRPGREVPLREPQAS
ncbi:MAG: NAD-binding protein [Methanoregulaceae archaeon]|nr:NAD-binding protein [Methanoregulaceae archaeon]